MYCLSLQYPVGHISFIAFTGFARKRERTHLRWAVSKSPSPITCKHPGKVCAGHRVSPPALWGVTALWCDALSLQFQQLLISQWGTHQLLPAPHISADRAWALCIPHCLWVSGELAERRAPLRMLKNHPHLQSWLSMNESCFVRCTLANPGISLCLRMKTSMMIFPSS